MDFIIIKNPQRRRKDDTTFTGIFIDASKLEKTYLDQIDTFEVQIYEESVQAAGFGDYKKCMGILPYIKEREAMKKE